MTLYLLLVRFVVYGSLPYYSVSCHLNYSWLVVFWPQEYRPQSSRQERLVYVSKLRGLERLSMGLLTNTRLGVARRK